MFQILTCLRSGVRGKVCWHDFFNCLCGALSGLSPIVPVGKFLLKGKYNAAKMTPTFVKLSEYNTPLYFFLKKNLRISISFSMLVGMVSLPLVYKETLTSWLKLYDICCLRKLPSELSRLQSKPQKFYPLFSSEEFILKLRNAVEYINNNILSLRETSC